MNTLILDCSYGMSVYLIYGDKIISKCDYNQKKHTDELLLAVNELLENAKINVNELDNVCICIGPGSFTGIRVAISIAKGLSIGSNLKIYTCSNFDTYSYGEKDKTIYILDGFSQYVYIRIFNGKNCEDSCEHFEDFISLINEKYSDYKVVVQSEKLQNTLKNHQISANFAQNNIISCFKDKILRNEYTQINQISPIYLRASQAEIERAEKLKKGEIK